ncbi:UbiX family flavin prenyltransferase [Candidatus Enterococcus leclercqii]|uniref:UbiX family flavin prenyltransferase n=1 Tax=Candidatus Enterococcus leclercqii TaxID=1857218 RepID=UPI001379F6BF|nr:UbiX family flavin prenyltransferase [Enterococcus sp. CU9D]KAF1290743.1 3-octaprenyl-4-hydroxybenzoate carboxy-lyase [Enterococcus sp. CU9D]
MTKKRILVAMTGASGSLYGVRLLQALQAMPDVEVHGILSHWAKENLRLETQLTPEEVGCLCDVLYDENEQSAAVASGSYPIDATVIVPASMKTCAAIACGFADNLITRTADVALKEQRPLILVPRETPLSTIHLENLTKLSRLGARILPPMPAFYNQPRSIEDLLEHQTMKLLDALHLTHQLGQRWSGATDSFQNQLR